MVMLCWSLLIPCVLGESIFNYGKDKRPRTVTESECTFRPQKVAEEGRQKEIRLFLKGLEKFYAIWIRKLLYDARYFEAEASAWEWEGRRRRVAVLRGNPVGSVPSTVPYWAAWWWAFSLCLEVSRDGDLSPSFPPKGASLICSLGKSVGFPDKLLFSLQEKTASLFSFFEESSPLQSQFSWCGQL